MRSLAEFQGNQEIFPFATQLPPFFETNLVDDARVVRSFLNDPQAHIRIFYYQYLKICFENQNQNSTHLVEKLQELINNPTFKFIFYSEDDPSIFNDTQAKQFIMEFFGLLSTGQISVFQALNKYPIMDVIFVHFFRTLLILMNQTDSLDNYIPRNYLLDFLCEFFGIEKEDHDECIKYVETDVFVYDFSIDAVFMAYMDYSAEESYQAPPQPTRVQEVPPPKLITPPPVVEKAEPVRNLDNQNYKNIIKESYIASQFVDFTSEGSNTIDALTSKAKNVVRQSGFAPGYNPSKPSPSSSQMNSQNVQIKPQIIQPLKSNVSTPQPPQPKQQIPVPTPVLASPQIIQPPQPKSQVIPPPQEIPKSVPIDNYQPPVPQQILTQAQVQNKSQPLPPQQIIQPPAQTKYQPPQPLYNEPPVVTKNSYSNETYSSNYEVNSKFQTKITTGSTDFKSDMFYNPKPAYNANVETNNNKTYSGSTTGKRKPFGLNVSDEFTSEDTIRAMAEPHKTNVINIKTRARNFRTNLVSATSAFK